MFALGIDDHEEHMELVKSLPAHIHANTAFAQDLIEKGVFKKITNVGNGSLVAYLTTMAGCGTWAYLPLGQRSPQNGERDICISILFGKCQRASEIHATILEVSGRRTLFVILRDLLEAKFRRSLVR